MNYAMKPWLVFKCNTMAVVIQTVVSRKGVVPFGQQATNVELFFSHHTQSLRS